MELQQTRDPTAEAEETQEGKGDRIGHLPLSHLVWLRLVDFYYVLCPQALTMSSSPLGAFPQPYLTSQLCLLHLTPS